MEVYLIRHGQSQANAGGVHSGWLPVSLTPLGRQQAAATRNFIKNVPFDKIVVSDLPRALETAQIIFPNRIMTLRSDIREYDTSNLSGRKVADLQRELGQVYANARRELDYGPLGCEAQADFVRRLEGFRAWLAPQPWSRVAVVCHAGVIRTLGAMTLGISVAQFNAPVQNGGVCVLGLNDGAWRLLRWNCGALA